MLLWLKNQEFICGSAEEWNRVLRAGRELIKDIAEGVYWDPVEMDLIVQVGPGGSTGVANQGDCFAPFDMLTLFCQGLFEVCIFCYQTITMFEHQQVAVSVLSAPV